MENKIDLLLKKIDSDVIQKNKNKNAKTSLSPKELMDLWNYFQQKSYEEDGIPLSQEIFCKTILKSTINRNTLRKEINNTNFFTEKKYNPTSSKSWTFYKNEEENNSTNNNTTSFTTTNDLNLIDRISFIENDVDNIKTQLIQLNNKNTLSVEIFKNKTEELFNTYKNTYSQPTKYIRRSFEIDPIVYLYFQEITKIYKNRLQKDIISELLISYGEALKPNSFLEFCENNSILEKNKTDDE
jgi:hypothetical protein